MVGVVLPVEQPVFRSAGHNPVGFFRSLGYQIVDEGADVAGVPGENQRLPPLNLQRRVDARNQSLGGSLLVTGGTVELTRAIQARHLLALQRGQQLGGVHALILNGVGRAHHLGALQPRDRVHHGNLHIFRQTGREALNVQLLRVQTAGLNEELMPGLIGKTDDFRLDAGTIPGADTGDGSVIHGTAVQILPDDPVGFLVGVGQIAHGGVFHLPRRPEGKGLGRLIAGLDFHFGKVHAAAVDPGGCAGFEAAKVQPQTPQIVGKTLAWVHPVGTGLHHALACDHRAVQICSGGDDYRLGGIFRPQLGTHPGHMAVLCQDFRNLSLLELQIFLKLQGVFHHLLVFPAVCLCPQGMDGRAFAPVQHPVLDAGFVGGHAHFPAQRVQLPHQMSLAGSTDGGVTGHIAHRVQIDGKQNRPQTQPGSGQRSLNPRVARADHCHITVSRVICGH